MQSIKLQKGAREPRSKRAETVRPQLGKRCEKRRECDSVLTATNDENGDELNGETDDEDMEDGEMEVRNIRDPGQPTAKEHQEHVTTQSTVQIMVQILCDGAQRERAALEIRCSRRLGFLGEKESEDRVSLLLVIQERRHKMTVGCAGSEKRNGVSLDRTESSKIH